MEVDDLKNGNYILVLAPKSYPGKKYRSKYCYEHHLVYWKETGIVVSSDEVIHHIDGNKTNNCFSNLELKKKSLHDSEHQTSKGRKYVLLRCPCCEKIFERIHSNTHFCKNGTYTSCSRKCNNEISKYGHQLFDLSKNVVKVYRKYPKPIIVMEQ